MAVEIVVFSGARQGERLELDAGEFRVGGEPDCEVFFDPQADPGAGDRSALFRLADDGWYVKSIGAGELLVNQQPVSGKARIRSGDVVRMSDRGPDFSFTIVTAATKAAAKPPEPAPVWLPPSAATLASPPSLSPEDVSPLPSASPTPSGEAATAAPVSATSDEFGKRAFWLAGGLAVSAMFFLLVVCILLFVLVYSLISPSDGSGPSPRKDGTIVQIERATPKPEPGPTPPPEPSPDPWDTERTPPPEPSPDPWVAAFAQVKDAIYLLEVESSEYCWVLGTCCAISEDTLLCTARAACEMEWLRHEGQTAEKGPLEYKFSVTSRPSSKRLPVKESRIYAPFAKEQEKWVYVDLAVLTVDGPLAQVASLASQDELKELTTDYPLAVVGVGHEGERISKSFAGEPELAVGGIYLITRFDESPGSPWVLHLKMEAPKNARGSPVINERGKIVGVYSVATPPQGGVDMNLHWAPVVEPELIQTWIQDRDTTLWIPPFVPDFPREAKTDR